jgi:hypothetical protein
MDVTLFSMIHKMRVLLKRIELSPADFPERIET